MTFFWAFYIGSFKIVPMYDFDKENDKEFLREAGKLLQGRLLQAETLLAQKEIEQAKDDEIKQRLTEELLNLRRRVFDSKQERNPNRPRTQKKRKKSKLVHNKGQNPEFEEQDILLDEDVIDHKIESKCCPKCGADELRVMNTCFEESSEFEVIERKYLLKRHRRQKYACKGCNSVITAPGGVKLTPGGEYSIQMATQIVSDKFEDHIPLERQRKQMKRAGLSVEVKTLFGLSEHLYNRLRPLEEMIRQDVLSGHWVHLDESPINFYNPNKSKGYIWSMSNPRGAYYQFEPTRSGAVAQEMLRGYRTGNVVTDGFSGYNFLTASDEFKNVNHAFCWAHVRRKFYEAIAHDPKAQTIVDLIDDLYDIEHQADTIDDLEELRSKDSAVIINKFDRWVESMEGNYMDSMSLGKAINYYLQRKEGLQLFLRNKNVPLDNNMAERRQRCPVMGRKIFLHFKSINGADIGAFFYSVIESCKSNGLDARAYMNEMAHRSACGEQLESPLNYAKRINEQIIS